MRAIGVAAGGGEEAVDFAPGEEHEPRQHHERHRVLAERLSSRMPIASSEKAMNMVFSRPIRSEIHPNNGRVTPLSTRSIDSAR